MSYYATGKNGSGKNLQSSLNYKSPLRDHPLLVSLPQPEYLFQYIHSENLTLPWWGTQETVAGPQPPSLPLSDAVSRGIMVAGASGQGHFHCNPTHISLAANLSSLLLFVAQQEQITLTGSKAERGSVLVSV